MGLERAVASRRNGPDRTTRAPPRRARRGQVLPAASPCMVNCRRRPRRSTSVDRTRRETALSLPRNRDLGPPSSLRRGRPPGHGLMVNRLHSAPTRAAPVSDVRLAADYDAAPGPSDHRQQSSSFPAAAPPASRPITSSTVYWLVKIAAPWGWVAESRCRAQSSTARIRRGLASSRHIHAHVRQSAPVC